MDFVPQQYKGIFVPQSYKGIPLCGFGQCLSLRWGYSPDCCAALRGVFAMWRINSLEISNYWPVRLLGGRMRIADQVHVRALRNLQKVYELKLLRSLLWLALAVFVGFSGVPAAAQSYAYVPTHKSNSVSVINTVTQTTVATIPVGTNPWGVAVTPNGAFAYVTNQATNDVSVIDTASNSVVATIPVGSNPVGLAITPNGAFAYVANYLSSSLSVISTATNTVVGAVSTPTYPIAIAITPDGASAYVATNGDNIVSVISTASNTATASVPVGSIPRGVGITPDGAFAYVSNRMSDDVSVISTATNTVVATISGVALLPEGIAIKP